MKSMGIVRNLDAQGRICLPKAIRKRFNISFNDEVEIFVDDDGQVILKKTEAKKIAGELIKCQCCNTKIGTLTGGKIEVEDNYCICDQCENEVCSNCLTEIDGEHICVKCLSTR